MRRPFPPALGLALGLAGCYQPDYEQKPCKSDTGCPPDYQCQAERCRLRASLPPAAMRVERPVPVALPFSLGTFSATSFTNDSPPTLPVSLPAFFLDQSEVTVGEYRRCVEAGVCQPPGQAPGCNYTAAPGGGDEAREDHPLNCVDHGQAIAFCAFIGRRLPSEDEWEFAARGPNPGRKFPWGPEDPTDTRLCWQRKSTCPVRAFPATPPSTNDFHDLAGNLWEWTSSPLCAYPDRTRCESKYVIRGGSFSDNDPRILWATTRLANSASQKESNVGFRCAHSP